MAGCSECRREAELDSDVLRAVQRHEDNKSGPGLMCLDRAGAHARDISLDCVHGGRLRHLCTNLTESKGCQTPQVLLSYMQGVVQEVLHHKGSRPVCVMKSGYLVSEGCGCGTWSL